MSRDLVRRFVFENQGIRGQWVQIDAAWAALRAHQTHAPPVRELLGQATCAALLLASTLKFEGSLTFQLEGDGAVPLLVAQCTHDFRVRAVARAENVDPAADFRALVGSGRVIVTVESEDRATRYQGIVALRGNTLARCLESYFARSEQLPTAVQLAADADRAGGLLLQRIAEDGGRAQGEVLTRAAGAGAEAAPESADGERVWDGASAAVANLDRDLLLRFAPEPLLRRSFPAYDLRLFAGAPVRFQCRCDEARVTNILRALGASEVREVLAEQGAVTVTCEFCQRPYRFDAVDVERIFAQGIVARSPSSLN
ncbi:MAG TPA: Hsp33 family molecular chaperone HslO [Steroidobacteraceae bacterium]